MRAADAQRENSKHIPRPGRSVGDTPSWHGKYSQLWATDDKPESSRATRDFLESREEKERTGSQPTLRAKLSLKQGDVGTVQDDERVAAVYMD